MHPHKIRIVGLGIVGSAIASELARRGADVVGYDRAASDRAVESSAGETRILRRVLFESSAYAPWLDAAFEGWRRLAKSQDAALQTDCGALLVGTPDRPLVRAALGSGGVRLAAARAIERVGPLALAAGEVCVWDASAAILHADQCVRALRAEAVQCGARLQFDTDTDTDTNTDTDTDTDADADADADCTVLSAGLGTLALVPPRWRGLLRGERIPQVWCRVTSMAGSRPWPVVMWDRADGAFAAIRTPGTDEVKVIPAQGTPVTSYDQARRPVTDGERERAMRWLSERFPGVSVRGARTSPCHYTHSPDDLFAIGEFPGTRTFLAAACCGRGFKYAPATASHIADQLLGTVSPSASRAFDLARFTSAAHSDPAR